jgi:iron(III) transport system ATP-binding protein
VNNRPPTIPWKANGAGKAVRGKAVVTFAARLTFDDVSRRRSRLPARTLLRITAGVERPSGGRVLIDNQEVSGSNRLVPPEKRGVGLMFQDFALFPHLSILDDIAFG